MNGWVAAACLVGAALGVAWPAGRHRGRWRRLGFARSRGRSLVPLLVDIARAGPPRVVVTAAVLGGVLAAVIGGPVAGLAVAAYAAVGVGALGRRHRARAVAALRAQALDGIGAMAADQRREMIAKADDLGGALSQRRSAAVAAQVRLVADRPHDVIHGREALAQVRPVDDQVRRSDCSATADGSPPPVVHLVLVGPEPQQPSLMQLVYSTGDRGAAVPICGGDFVRGTDGDRVGEEHDRLQDLVDRSWVDHAAVKEGQRSGHAEPDT